MARASLVTVSYWTVALMSEVIVTGNDPDEHDYSEEAAHAAAAAEGAAEVHTEQAAEAAGEAAAAAEVALAAAQANIESGAAVAEATEIAEAAAEQATVSAEMVHEALLAQTQAITALTEELRAGRQQTAPPAPGKRSKRDRQPSGGGVKLVRR